MHDHILVVVADKPTIDASLNIQGTDWLLIVMPEIERAEGKVIAYLVPTEEAEAAVRKSHEEWLSSNPNTKGRNTTWNLRFSRSPSAMTGRQGKQGYHEIGPSTVLRVMLQPRTSPTRTLAVPGNREVF